MNASSNSPTNPIQIVNCHAEGEIGDVIVGGVQPPPGKTIWEQRSWIAADQTLRNLVLNEPRGHVAKHVNLLVPAIHAEADIGWIIMEPVHTPPMSGSNSICVSTVVLEQGIVPMQEPVTHLTLEAPGGIVRVKADCENGKVKRATVKNVNSFVDRLSAKIELENIGTLEVHTAYGGDSFVLCDADGLGLSMTPDEGRDIVELGATITRAANEQLGFNHPENPDWHHISFCQFTQAVTIDENNGGLRGKNTVVIEPGKLDRSPTGTGCSARMAVLHAQGQLKVGQTFTGVSILDSEFVCRVLGTAEVGQGEHARTGIVPELSGRAWVTGTQEIRTDVSDPWPSGYRVSDTWPCIK